MNKFIVTLLTITVFAGSALAAETAEAPKAKPYTLDTCIVTGEKLGTMGDAVVVIREGREIKFCCKGCIKDFDKDPAKFLKQIDAAEKAKAEVKTDKPAAAAQPAKHGCCP